MMSPTEPGERLNYVRTERGNAHRRKRNSEEIFTTQDFTVSIANRDNVASTNPKPALRVNIK